MYPTASLAAILAIGNPRIVNDALKLARKGARISFFAGFSKGDAPPIDVKELHAKIGQLALENDFLSGALGKAGLLASAKR